MIKKFFTIMIIYLIGNILLCQAPIEVERLGTDFNGVIENNGRIIAYGNYGVIVYSDDYGDNWSQINLGEFNHILKIVKDENGVLFALTKSSILYSPDNGNNWVQKQISKRNNIKDFVLKDDIIYFLADNKIWYIQKSLKANPNTFLEFEEFTSLKYCVAADRYLFVVDDNNYIYRIDIPTKNIDTIDVNEKLGNTYYTNIEKIKAIDGAIYLVWKNPKKYDPISLDALTHLVTKTTDFGNNWEIVTENLPVTYDFLVNKRDSSISTLRPKLLDFYFGLAYSKIFGKKSTDFVEFVQDTSKGIYFPYLTDYGIEAQFNYYNITGLTRCEHRDSVIVAVGKYKTILVSKDDGRNWTMKSFFRPFSRDFLDPGRDYHTVLLGNDTIICASRLKPYYFFSTDKGTTFLPFKYEFVNIPIPLSSNGIFGFTTKNGTFGILGMKKNRNSYLSDTLVGIYSSDFGRTFTKKDFPIGHTLYNDSITPILESIYYEPNKDHIYLKTMLVKTEYDYKGPSYLICVFNNSIDLIDTIKLYSYDFSIYPYEEGLLLIDSLGIYKYNEISKSLDTLGIYPIYRAYNASYRFAGIHKNDILINEISKTSSRLIKFNLKTGSFDSLNLMSTSTYSRYLLTEFNDTAILASQDVVYIFPDLSNDFASYKVYSIHSLISDSSSIITQFGTPENNLVSLEKYFGRIDWNSYYLINLARYSRGKTYLTVEEEVNKITDYLFATPPYPNPTQDYVYVKVYWDTIGDEKTLKIEIFDIFGRKHNLPQEIVSKEINSAIIRINTSSLLFGTYYVRLNYGLRNIIFPIAIVN
ncbi:MAG: T9SS type A sorting domain-containing protein [Candidatus Kapaibacteriota bacterium]